jgi:alkylation response protein AidB-like acyl-CoA dehydrogenase
VTVTKLEHKMGIRVSDTAALSLQEARVPYDHILGSATVQKSTSGFKGVMATFDATRPLVAASGVGVARAALEFVKEQLAERGVQVRYGLPRQKLTAVERDLIDMEIMLRSAWLMVIKAVWMADNQLPNALESAMSKVRAGDVVTRITQKAVEITGLQSRVPARKVVPGRQDHGHLRGDRANQSPGGRPPDPGLLRQGSALRRGSARLVGVTAWHIKSIGQWYWVPERWAQRSRHTWRTRVCRSRCWTSCRPTRPQAIARREIE